MQDVEKLRQNVLMLILAETGATTDDAQLASLQADDEIGTLLTNLITKVTARTPVAVETTEASPLVANDDTLADEPKVVLTKSDDIPVVAPETAVLPTPDDGQKAPFEPLEVQGDTTLPEETAKENLKPGQIPSGTATPISTPQNNQPQAKINVANARTGVPFHSEIDIVLDDGTTAEVLAVTFSKDIGITLIRRPLHWQEPPPKAATLTSRLPGLALLRRNAPPKCPLSLTPTRAACGKSSSRLPIRAISNRMSPISISWSLA